MKKLHAVTDDESSDGEDQRKIKYVVAGSQRAAKQRNAVIDTESSESEGEERNKRIVVLGSQRAPKKKLDALTGDESSESECPRKKKILVAGVPTDREQNESAIIVPISRKTTFGGRVYDKEQCCLFCGKCLKMKITRHYVEVHKNEFEEYMAKLSYDRNTSLRLLRNRGNFFHNVKVMREQKGELILVRRPTSGKISHTEFLPCSRCLGFFLKAEIWRHQQFCDIKAVEEGPHQFIQCGSLLLYSSVNDSYRDVLKDVVADMRKDDTYIVIKNDIMILTYGSYIYETKGVDKKNYVSEKMRNLARLLKELRKQCNNEDGLIDFISPKFFDNIISATKVLCKFSTNDELERTSKVPSLALKLGHALKKCATLKHGIGLNKENDMYVRSAKQFITLFGIHWSNRISSTALKSLADNKFTKAEQLPVTEDLLKLKSYLIDDMVLMMQRIDAGAEVQDWRQLAEDTVARILIFNKKRCNEAAKLTCQLYLNRPDWNAAQIEDIRSGLQPIEKVLCNR